MPNFIQPTQPIQEIILILVLPAIIVILLGWLVFLQLSLRKLKKKNQEFFGKSNVSNLEDLIISQGKTIKSLDKDIHELYNISNQINNLAFRSLHKVGVVRFNPFKDMGGDQSFSIALLNGRNNGVVISSLYTREGTRVYSKAISQGESKKYPLTEEEEQAIRTAMSSEPKKI